ncbi:CRTAC1 family protein [Loktanella sp. TSTF-M6]|uniref:CRTAC1 family protein n=1 Tax=Loktanella gaetbuli TaxID=2881335 RepID=A0ABS8BRX8_9RHOB|nr:CRTAC1 family protein [Loktanella gaetbuli]MCB5198382.1 CRTAC1 family protein [Loktanella gaetbuli]
MIRALILMVWAAPAAAQVSFTDVSDRLGDHVYDGGWEHFVGGGVAVMDCDGDARPDIFAAGGSNPAALWRNTGDMQFAPMPLPTLTGVTGAYPLDIDADGHMDLYVMRVGPDVALRGGPDCTFTDATDLWGLPQTDQWTTAFTAWWEDDNRPVMAVGHYVDRADPDGPFEACDTNTILRPTPKGYRADTLDPGFCALSMLAATDARGRMALRISNDRHYYVRTGYEQMWDIADRRFLGQADGWEDVSLWGMGIASADLTGDGRDEVMLTSMGDQLMQLAQPDGTYTRAPFGLGTYAQRPFIGDDGRPSTGWHAEFGDVNNDARPDLFIAKGNVDQMPTNAMADPNNMLIQKPDGSFTETAEAAGVADTARARGAALADFDGDGLLDLVVVNRRANILLFQNTTQQAGHWIGLSLSQPGGNRNAIGARVSVTTDQGTQIRELRVGGGHAGGQALPLHVGLGHAKQADVTITWTDGTTSRATYAAGRIHSIQRP